MINKSDLRPESNNARLDLCAQEPIRFPGAIQSHGCLMVVNIDGKVWAASDNVGARLRISATALFDSGLWRSVPSEWLVPLQSTFEHFASGGERWLTLTVGLNEPWEVRVQNVKWGYAEESTTFLLEWLPGSNFSPDEEWGLFEGVSRALRGLNESASLVRYLQDVVVAIQRFTGYERVMVYRFDKDWSGEVLAEAVALNAEQRYLDHRFPAGDIPENARALYLEKTIRVIADADAAPATLCVSPDAPAKADELDLGSSSLRAISPVHLQYLRNMGVQASVVLSLIHRGRLWGMLVCHHPEPRLPPKHMTHSLCVASEIMLGNVTNHVDSLVALENAQSALKLQKALLRFERSIEHLGRKFTLSERANDLIASFGADSISICLEGNLLFGEALPQALNERLQRYWEDSSDLVFQTRALQSEWPEVCTGDWPYVGVMACRLGPQSGSWVVLLRREQVEHIRWAGNPYQKVSDIGDGEPLTPRVSFSTWVESVGQTSLPWLEQESNAIVELSRLILLRRQGWEVRRYQETLRKFMERQEQLLLQDRSRMAMLVHDQLGQLMAAARFKIGHLAGLRALDRSVQPEQIQSAMDDLEEAMEVVRNLSHRLYPLVLRHGLMPALESLVDEFMERSDMTIRMDGPSALPPMPKQVTEVFFGIAREALNNVVRHSSALTARLSILATGNIIEMCIEDEGIGFPSLDPNDQNHFGVFGMRERARWIDADLVLSNRPDGGARVWLRWNGLAGVRK